MRIFLTGDNHIGLKYASHPQAAVLAASRISAFEHMVELANDEQCDLFVIAGDLFENTRGIAKRDIKNLQAMLSDFRGMVAVLPGNHDYYDGDVEVWRNFKEAMGAYDNIMLLSEYRPYPLAVGDDTVVLYPALCTAKHSEPEQNNLGWIKELSIENDGAYHIGIAHGAVDGETIDKEGKYFLMTRDELGAIPLDVWLIGHTHIPLPRDLTEEFALAGRIFNAGTHVQTDVNCKTEGLCFVIDIAPDKTVQAKKVVSGNLRFYRKNIKLTAGNMSDTLMQELADIADNSVVDLRLSGAVLPEEYEKRDEIMQNVLSRFIEATYDDAALSKLISKELIEREFAETSFSAGLLNALLDEPKEAQLAYELLKSLKGEQK